MESDNNSLSSSCNSEKTMNINDIIPEYNWEYLRVKPYPFSNIELTKSFFEDKDLVLFEKSTGPPLSSSSEPSTCYFGKIIYESENQYEDEEVYFYVMDDPGLSGYDCCGVIILYYSDSIDIVKENMNKYYT